MNINYTYIQNRSAGCTIHELINLEKSFGKGCPLRNVRQAILNDYESSLKHFFILEPLIKEYKIIISNNYFSYY